MTANSICKIAIEFKEILFKFNSESCQRFNVCQKQMPSANKIKTHNKRTVISFCIISKFPL